MFGGQKGGHRPELKHTSLILHY